MEISSFIAEVLGLYFIIMGLMLLVRRHEIRKIAAELVAHRPLTLVTGTITLLIGLLLVLSHNEWVSGWEVIITIISWIILLKGIFILVAPSKIFDKIIRGTNRPPFYVVGGIIMLALGLFITAKGFGNL